MTSQMVSIDGETFWQYSVSRYATSDIAPLALLLQDQHGVNVNVLLLVCWCLENNIIVNLPQLKTVIEAAAKSESALKLHRDKRKLAKPEHPSTVQNSTNANDESSASSERNAETYELLKTQELALEKQQQEAIIEAFNQLDVHLMHAKPSGDGIRILNASIAAFINVYSLRENSEARSLVSQLVSQLP
ncbi:TIGR02444 family protein [Alteromonas sp. A081]|uniref:TIGR02444 family protein n=1 Tax=Alteromonas sp. A081 TaxID=3410269 RepID=UPI003B983630